MTDEELIREIAVEVMGWKLEDPENPYWVDRYGDYIMGGNLNDKDELTFDPLLNAKHWLLVVERMRELGWIWRADNETSAYWSEFSNGEKDFDAVNGSLGHAVCMAAIAAVRSE